MGNKKMVLLNPGPVMISERVRKSLMQPDICHREDEFFRIQRRVREKLVKVCGGDNRFSSVVITGSGTASLEAVTSLLSNLDGKILVINNGTYGERIKKIADIYGAKTREIKFDLDKPISVGEIESVLKEDPSIEAIAVVHHETTTGMLNPLDEISKLAKRYGKILFVDAISSVGAEKLSVKEQDIDFCVGDPNKCIQSIPGVSFVCFKKSTLEKFRKKPRKLFYLDLITLYDFQEKDDTPFTPAVHAFYALDAALDELLKEGVDNRRARYRARAEELREGLISMGFESYIPLEYYSSTLASFKLPADITYEELHDELKKRGFIIYAPQAILGSRVFRVANMGELTRRHIKSFISNLGPTLKKLRSRKPTKVIVLAAGVGKRLGRVSKPMLRFGGKTLIERNIQHILETGLKNITIVTGYLEDKVKKTVKEKFSQANIRFISNPAYDSSGSGYSLLLAERIFRNNDFIFMDADILYDARILNFLLNCSHENVVLVDPQSGFEGEEVSVFARENRVVGLGKDMRYPELYAGEAIGMYRFSKSAGRLLANELKTILEKRGKNVEYEDVLDSLAKQVSIYPRRIPPLPWIEIDTEEDMIRAKKIILPKTGG
jgi:2-aminoethylphosphonate-pyruvate transaminase